jgi:exodeoxyribonuclease-3
LVSAPERDAFRRLIELGFKDSFRLFEQPEKSFTWWDYRMNGFKRNLGLRIDHILLSAGLAANCDRCSIDLEPRRNERPSDHAPVVAEINVCANRSDTSAEKISVHHPLEPVAK